MIKSELLSQDPQSKSLHYILFYNKMVDEAHKYVNSFSSTFYSKELPSKI